MTLTKKSRISLELHNKGMNINIYLHAVDNGELVQALALPELVYWTSYGHHNPAHGAMEFYGEFRPESPSFNKGIDPPLEVIK